MISLDDYVRQKAKAASSVSWTPTPAESLAYKTKACKVVEVEAKPPPVIKVKPPPAGVTSSSPSIDFRAITEPSDQPIIEPPANIRAIDLREPPLPQPQGQRRHFKQHRHHHREQQYQVHLLPRHDSHRNTSRRDRRPRLSTLWLPTPTWAQGRPTRDGRCARRQDFGMM
jgi:hypothetical protein